MSQMKNNNPLSLTQKIKENSEWIIKMETSHTSNEY